MPMMIMTKHMVMMITGIKHKTKNGDDDDDDKTQGDDDDEDQKQNSKW